MLRTPGTAARLSGKLRRTAYAVNPRFLAKSTQWLDSDCPPRIAYAGPSGARALLARLYSGFPGSPCFASDSYEAVELLKYIENSIDAVLISLWNESVLMLNSFRYPTGRYSLELPMGAVDSGESPEAAARRELREETGVIRDRLDFLGWFFALPGLSDQRAHVFGSIASDDELRSARTPDSEAALAGVVLVRVEQVPWLAAAGKVTDSLTLCGLALAGIGVRAQHGAGG
jgi:8-oxo-dGTP pyrophosphatase MutT (NUDIX family)